MNISFIQLTWVLIFRFVCDSLLFVFQNKEFGGSVVKFDVRPAADLNESNNSAVAHSGDSTRRASDSADRIRVSTLDSETYTLYNFIVGKNKTVAPCFMLVPKSMSSCSSKLV